MNKYEAYTRNRPANSDGFVVGAKFCVLADLGGPVVLGATGQITAIVGKACDGNITFTCTIDGNSNLAAWYATSNSVELI